MHTLTQIHLDNGEMALYLDGYYLGSGDSSGATISFRDIVAALRKVPSICHQIAWRPLPVQEDWCWNEVADQVFPRPGEYQNKMTVQALMARLSAYPADAACCGIFWMNDDFLELDEHLTTDEIDLAMEIAENTHDASVGFNWDHIRSSIEQAKD
jgi:hypothetical protein